MVSTEKKKLVQQLVSEIRESPIVGVLNLENLPGEQLQKMRSLLRQNKILIMMARKRLLNRALHEAQKSNVSNLAGKIKGSPALIFSQDNPFKLYATLQKNKSEASAKPGQIAPKDIIVKAGPTNFAPGPIISELAAVGIKTKVEAGKLSVIVDTTIVQEGEIISPKVSETMKRLDIKPMEIGLNLVAVWENGLIFDATQLHIDEAAFARQITEAAQMAMNLAVECAYPTTETTELLLQKAFREAKSVALEGAVMTPEMIEEIIVRSEQQALSVQKEAKLL